MPRARCRATPSARRQRQRAASAALRERRTFDMLMLMPAPHATRHAAADAAMARRAARARATRCRALFFDFYRACLIFFALPDVLVDAAALPLITLTPLTLLLLPLALAAFIAHAVISALLAGPFSLPIPASVSSLSVTGFLLLLAEAFSMGCFSCRHYLFNIFDAAFFHLFSRLFDAPLYFVILVFDVFFFMLMLITLMSLLIYAIRHCRLLMPD